MGMGLSDAYCLMHDGAVALSVVESAGMRIDTAYLAKASKETADKIAALESSLKTTDVWALWSRRFGAKASLASRVQLGAILFGEMKLPAAAYTKTGRPSTSERDLERIDHAFVRDYFRMSRLQKLHGTYLKGIANEVQNGYLHPVFNLHLVTSYRSSSDSPNFQNIPIRNTEIAQIIRRAFIPRRGHVLIEIDFVAIEVRIAACYHRDPTMLRHIATDHDLHKDMAAECFLLPQEQVTKTARYAAKNGFVFPAFYGDYHVGIATSMWAMISKLKLSTADGQSMVSHLASRGICNQGQFLDHIKAVEDRFWNSRFSQYNQWRADWWARYERRGWFRLLTGFVCNGVYRRNEVINLPVQGAAFHCLLWSLIRLVKWLGRNRMASKIVGQIHDSIVIDAHREEVQDLIAFATQTMTQDLPAAWPWIITPMKVEIEMAETNWWEKKPFEGV